MCRTISKYFLTVLLLSVLTNTVIAQKFSASIERTTVGQNDRFQVDFTFEGGDVNSVSNFRQPNFAGFRVLSGPNQSSSMQIINGRASGSISLSYIL
ncbi:MAG: BatD family protein, partial [Ignavibacteria bacterium]|nr:BatD family protein [Ignavibacteria bacterium]